MDPLGISAILDVFGTIGQAVGGANQARQQSRAYKQQAAQIDAQTTLERAAAEKRNAMVMAKSRAVAGAAGVDPNSGTPLEVELDNAFNAAMNEASIQYAGDINAYNARTKGRQIKAAIPGLYAQGALKGGGILSQWYGKSKYGTLGNPFGNQTANVGWSGYGSP